MTCFSIIEPQRATLSDPVERAMDTCSASQFMGGQGEAAADFFKT